MRKFAAWLPAVTWAAIIFYLSHGPPSPDVPPWIFVHDKLSHAVAFGLLSGLIYFAFRRGHGIPPSQAVWFAALLASLYGATDEVHQCFIPGRESDWLDWLADVVGAVAMAIASFYLDRGANRRATDQDQPSRQR